MLHWRKAEVCNIACIYLANFIYCAPFPGSVILRLKCGPVTGKLCKTRFLGP